MVRCNGVIAWQLLRLAAGERRRKHGQIQVNRKKSCLSTCYQLPNSLLVLLEHDPRFVKKFDNLPVVAI